MARQRTDVGTRIARARGADLTAVLRSLGAERDRYDKAKWRIDGQVISVRGEKFYDHVAGHGGGGAVDLVMHVRDVPFHEALAYLDSAALPQAPASSGSSLGRMGRDDAALGLPFRPPHPNDESWPGVRDYLVAERRLPGTLVNELYSRGLSLRRYRHIGA
jgi:hypothetical protein